ncbi:hypothetical protein A3B45_05490 [Candidatus Daviesbacteria bacterium RIFCSPLOWO2_01_FULL_39_12]|uniref:Phosphoribosyl-AMP cyclohydrolase n=1 Tax=Candidatus Daviesbacteria bacterium RIFCSPLOWO2_01_FULL_39_12 TaxID=1797785 RepID=A0A1F5KUA4_9BACT|nr:MAG: hypothetical protein A3D79_03550 [Candidatus Daviesbacteria bacterium RIFCSPHIGHO2_02_FULL_39_8]OGE44201.1 MAG: hypothetical protein A3B45_05490 [Candidatus Daviesbacteria bacterium RIFCSPLOWO2_01_FULL_39_12]
MIKEFELPDLKLDFTKLYTDQGIGIIPAVILDAPTDKLLTVAFMNPEAIAISRETRLAALLANSETSGNNSTILG